MGFEHIKSSTAVRVAIEVAKLGGSVFINDFLIAL
jgi:hypothetical protein